MTRMIQPQSFLSRRRFLADTGGGLGAIALAWLLQNDSYGAEPGKRKPGPHFAPKGKRAIHIFSPGGVSHVDTFDYKPELAKFDGKPLTSKGQLDPFFGKPGNLLKNLCRSRNAVRAGSGSVIYCPTWLSARTTWWCSVRWKRKARRTRRRASR